MKASRRVLTYLVLVALVFCVGERALARRKKTRTALVIPARYGVVKFAVDVHKVADIEVISYQDGVEAGDAVLHMWQNGRWVSMSVESYSKALPDTIVLVGDDNTVPRILAKVSARATSFKHVKTLDIGTLAYSLWNTLDMGERDFRWLAKRHGLKVKDLNWKRRRYGRWGRSGEGQVEEEMPPRVGLEPKRVRVPNEPDIEPIEEILAREPEDEEPEADDEEEIEVGEEDEPDEDDEFVK